MSAYLAQSHLTVCDSLICHQFMSLVHQWICIATFEGRLVGMLAGFSSHEQDWQGLCEEVGRSVRPQIFRATSKGEKRFCHSKLKLSFPWRYTHLSRFHIFITRSFSFIEALLWVCRCILLKAILPIFTMILPSIIVTNQRPKILYFAGQDQQENQAATRWCQEAAKFIAGSILQTGRSYLWPTRELWPEAI